MGLGKDYIGVLASPTIPLKELWATDDSEVNERNAFWVAPANVATGKSKIGADVPFWKINNVLIPEVDYLVIDETGFIPRIKVIFSDKSGALSGPNYPKNDPILSVYIKTQNEKFKPVRCDFLITRIKTSQDAVKDAKNLYNGLEFIMQGELFVPKLLAQYWHIQAQPVPPDTVKETQFLVTISLLQRSCEFDPTKKERVKRDIFQIFI